MSPFLAELKRRKVVRVAAMYAAMTFVVLQAADLILPALMLPEWTYRLLVLLALAGFPLVVVLGWALEVTPDGVRLTQPRDQTTREDALPSLIGRRTLLATALLVAAGSGLGAGIAFGPGPRHGHEAFPQSALPAPATAAIAILPFSDFSPGGDQEWFSDGLTEELLNALARVPGLRVAARTSSFAFKGQSIPVDEVARRLNVTHVLEGSVRRSDERLRITAQLIAASDGYQLWSETYDRRLEDIFDIQEEISRAIATELRGRLGSDVRLATVPTRMTDPETYDLYLRGRFHWQRGSLTDQEQALDFFHRAVARDSSFVLAWVGLADSYNRLANWGHRPPREMLPRARAAAQGAVELDSLLAPARATFGHILRWWDHDRIAARREFQRALELQPDYVQANEWYAWFLADEGRIEEAIEHYRRAVELDPLSLSGAVSLGNMLIFAHRWQEAIAEYDRALRMPGNTGFGARGRAYAMYRAGRGAEAIAALEAMPQRDPWTTGGLGHIYAATGRTDDARRMLTELDRQAQHRHVSAHVYATVHVALGEYESALDELERGWRQGSLPPELNVIPEFEPLRSHPRFRALVRKLGIETGRGESPWPHGT
jgi:adenylate cyclase